MSASRKIQGLTPKEKVFCYSYFNNNGNGTAAAIEAGYSKKSAHVFASRLLNKVKVQKLLIQLQSTLEEKAVITKERIAQELAKVGFFDIRKAYKEDGTLKQILDMPDGVASVISGIKVFEEFEGKGEEREKIGETVELKLNSKIAALAELNKMFGYNAPTKVAATDPDGNPIKIVTQVEIVPPHKIDSD